MDGIHDMGGMEGFGPVPYVADDGAFHEEWEPRAFVAASFAIRASGRNTDAFRHTIERIPPAEYLAAGYYGRWLRAAAMALEETGVLTGAEPSVRPTTAHRDAGRPPRFDAGDRVRVRDLRRSGHTRLPAYCRGRVGVVERRHPTFVFPDTHAHGDGDDPQHVYAVRFAGTELWGPDADPAVAVHVDLFDDYLETVA